jgi:hypothetical protein
MRHRLALRLAAAAVLSTAGTGVQAQTTIIETHGTITRGIHEPALVTPVDPALAAPDAAPTAVDPVTVEAKRPTPNEVKQQSLRFVETYAAATAKLDQFARWREPVCIEVTAPDPAVAARITERIGEVARSLGVKVLKAGCGANIEIVFANPPQRWLDWVAEHRDTILGFHHVSDTQALKTVVRPIQAWYVTATRSDALSSAGLAFFGPGNGLISGVSSKSETLDDPRGTTPAGCGGSRFTSCLQSVFKNVLVFVDTGRLKDPDMGPVADYLAMLTLSQPRSLDGCAALPSVIDLLAPHCPGRLSPNALTPADLAYLKALYRADLEARRPSAEVDIASRMADSLIKARRPSPEGNSR